MPRFVIAETHQSVRFEGGIWKGPTLVPPRGYQDLGKRLFSTMKDNAELIGQIDPETGFKDTYGNMADRCVRCAIWLQKQGIKPGDIFSLYTTNHVNSIIPIISSLMIGSIVNPWWPNMCKDTLLNFAVTTRPKILFVEGTNAESTKKILKDADMDIMLVSFQKVDGFTNFEELLAVPTDDEVARFQCFPVESPDTPAMIIFSSGSTGGQPKGVLLSYGSLALTDTSISTVTNGNNNGMILSSVCWIVYVIYYFEAIKTAGTVIISASSAGDDRTFNSMEKYKVNWIAMNTIATSVFVNTSDITKYDFSPVKYVLYGGTAVSQNLMIKLSEIFPGAVTLYCYGITEAGGRISAQIGIEKNGSSGKVGLNTEVKMVDERGEAVLRPRQIGEVYIRTPCSMIEYYNNAQATDACYDSDGWFRTGDCGYFDEDGDIFIVDRLKDLIKGRGIHLSPTAIERVIKEHPGVLNVAVVARLCKDSLECPMAFVVRKKDFDVTKEDIIDIVARQNSSTFNLDGGVRFVDTLPTTATGKIHKSVLRQMIMTNE